jgi:uncharacterized metal-binding protein
LRRHAARTPILGCLLAVVMLILLVLLILLVALVVAALRRVVRHDYTEIKPTTKR